jgi:type II secretory pathway pseudopilin PulG
LYRRPVGFLISKPRTVAGQGLPRRHGLDTHSGLRVVRAAQSPIPPMGVRKKVGIAVIVIAILLGVFLVYQLESQAQQASNGQQSQTNQAAQQALQQVLEQEQQGQNVLGRTTPVLLNPGQSQDLGQYLTAGTNVTLDLLAVGTTQTIGFFGTVCYSLAAPSGTWLVGNGKSNLSCVGGDHYLHQFVAPETGNYTLFVQEPTSGNYQDQIEVTAIFIRN